MFIIAIIYTILNQNRQQIPDSKRAPKPTKLSRASPAFLSWALLEIILSCAHLQVQTQFITPKNGIKWTALFHYRLMKQQFHDCNQIWLLNSAMFWHSASTLFKGCVSFKVLCREASFTSMKPPIGFGGNLALADWRERLSSMPWGCRDSSATISANMEQESNIQRKRVVYSIVTVWHMVHDLYVDIYGTDQQPQHPHCHNQLSGGVVVMSDITNILTFYHQTGSNRRIQLSCWLLNKT